jgi:hypothetical protein
MSLNEMIKAGKNFPKIGAFQIDELNLIKEVFLRILIDMNFLAKNQPRYYRFHSNKRYR